MGKMVLLTTQKGLLSLVTAAWLLQSTQQGENFSEPGGPGADEQAGDTEQYLQNRSTPSRREVVTVIQNKRKTRARLLKIIVLEMFICLYLRKEMLQR